MCVCMFIICMTPGWGFFSYFSLQVGNGGNSDTYSWHQTLEEV